MKKTHFILLLFLTSCAPTIKDFASYQKDLLPRSNFVPSAEELKNNVNKVVVFNLEENNKTAIDAGLGKSIADNVENVLGSDKLAQIIDRSAATKLKQEIALAETMKTGSYKGPQIADYAISGSISNAGFTKKYQAPSSYYNQQTQSFVNIPARFNYQANVDGNIKIYELPSMKVMQNFNFSGFVSRSENVQQSGGFAFGSLSVGGESARGAERDDGLVRSAGRDAIENIAVDIKNFFGKKGYILEKRIYKGKAIFRINLGSNDGIKQGDRLEIVTKYESQNPITEEIEVESMVIGQALVSDQIHANSAWIIVKNKDEASKIRLGDQIKVKYKRDNFSSAVKVIKPFLQN